MQFSACSTRTIASKGNRRRCACGLAAGVGLFLAAAVVSRSGGAATRVFTLDPARSSLTASGTVYLDSPYYVTASFLPQQPGSDKASYSGAITTTIDTSGIEFLSSGTSLSANNFVGPALMPDTVANYGFNVTYQGALVADATTVGLTFNTSSPYLPVNANGGFTVGSYLVMTTTGGSTDFVTTPPVQTAPLAGSSGTNATAALASLSLSGQTQTLTIPVTPPPWSTRVPCPTTLPSRSPASWSPQPSPDAADRVLDRQRWRELEHDRPGGHRDQLGDRRRRRDRHRLAARPDERRFFHDLQSRLASEHDAGGRLFDQGAHLHLRRDQRR